METAQKVGGSTAGKLWTLKSGEGALEPSSLYRSLRLCLFLSYKLKQLLHVVVYLIRPIVPLLYIL